jgi:hypothetical protein
LALDDGCEPSRAKPESERADEHELRAAWRDVESRDDADPRRPEAEPGIRDFVMAERRCVQDVGDDQTQQSAAAGPEHHAGVVAGGPEITPPRAPRTGSEPDVHAEHGEAPPDVPVCPVHDRAAEDQPEGADPEHRRQSPR